ncbi:hypothetical protein LJC58_01550 [Lachnospiraceae bacterium OttesenSCG-928-D06]|nr:hypothetical protein [Lachnospiraceae bacterium OttesenSCG-928-D06]
MLNYLYDRYPEVAKQAADASIIEERSDPADKEGFCRFPILIDTRRMTEARIANMISFLIGKLEAPKHYMDLLQAKVLYQEVFNYMTNRYQRAYEPDSLWNTFFLGQEDLRSVIERRRINSLDELVYRASEYFESYGG